MVVQGAGASVRFGILGPLTVWRDGGEVEVGGPRVRILLALLLVEAGRLVPASRLIDGLWGEDPPRGAANALQSHVSRRRSALAPDVQLQSRPEGYLLAVEPDAVDAALFERLAAAGGGALTEGAPARAAQELAEALALCSPASPGTPGWTWARAWARTMAGNLLQRDADGAGEATHRFTEAAAEFRSLGDRSGLSQALASLAEVHRARGEGRRAERALEESLQQVRELGAREDATSLLIRLGGVQLALGKRAEGEASIEEGARPARELGSPDTLAAAYFMQGQDARRRGDLTAARALFEETERIAPPDRHFPPFRRLARIGQGLVAELLGDADHAEALHRGVLEELRAEPSNLLIPFVVAAALDGLAGVAVLRGDPERSAELLGAAAARRRFELQDERIDTDRIAGAALDALGSAAFDAAYERGKASRRRRRQPDLRQLRSGPSRCSSSVVNSRSSGNRLSCRLLNTFSPSTVTSNAPFVPVFSSTPTRIGAQWSRIRFAVLTARSR